MLKAFLELADAILDINQWFSIDLLKSFHWEQKLFLYLIPFVPLLFVLKWLFSLQSKQKLVFSFFKKQNVGFQTSWIVYLRFLPDIIFTLFVVMILIALARPQQLTKKVQQASEGIEIVLALDISESMLIEDFQPNRLEVAKKVATNFINGRKHDRIGVVVFSGDAFSLCPLTNDYKLLKHSVNGIYSKMIKTSGTAIGNALAVSINRLRESNAKSKVIILISDGANVEGKIDPSTAAKLAHAYNIKIYSIGIGKDGDVPYKDDKGEVHQIKNTMDESTLREVSYLTQGQYFRAGSREVLTTIFGKIDKMEKAKITETSYLDTKDYYYYYLKIGITFFLLWLLLKSTFISNPLED